MKPATYLFFLIGFFSCGQAQKQNNAVSSQDTIVQEQPIVKQNTVEEPANPMELPTGFQLDTFEKNDASNLSMFIVLPVFGVKQIDKIVSTDIEKQKNDFLKSLDGRIKKR